MRRCLLAFHPGRAADMNMPLETVACLEIASPDAGGQCINPYDEVSPMQWQGNPLRHLILL